MGEKTTIEIERMRELKQHALDTNKTLKQIINEAIEEKINREREKLNLPKIFDSVEDSKVNAVDDSDTEVKSAGSFAGDDALDPEILAIIRSECAREGIDLNNLSKSNWNVKLEFNIQTALEMLYDETVANNAIKKIKMDRNIS